MALNALSARRIGVGLAGKKQFKEKERVRYSIQFLSKNARKEEDRV